MTDDSHGWKKISSKFVHENPYFLVRQDSVIEPNGKPAEYFVVANNPSVFIAAFTDQQELILIKQFRYMTKRVSVELPAGGTDGEDPLTAAKRELQEETGYIAHSWKHLAKVQGANGMSDQEVDVYLATGLEQTDNHEQEEEGISEMLKVQIPKVLEMIKNGEISDLQSIGAISIVNLHI